jgi:hypothetical protein
MRKIGDTHEKTDRIEDVTFAGTVEASYGVEGRVKAVNFGSVAVRLEAVYNHRFDVHGGVKRSLEFH